MCTVSDYETKLLMRFWVVRQAFQGGKEGLPTPGFSLPAAAPGK